MAIRKNSSRGQGKGPFVEQVLLRREVVPSFDAYPFGLPAIRHLERLPLHPKVTFLIGENGSGKSTLLEAMAIAWGFNAEGGSRNMNFRTRASHSELSEYLTLVKMPSRPGDGYFLRAESFYNVATEIEERQVTHAYGGKSLHEQSHGESFFSLFMHRLGGPGFYILDEPEAALSPMRQMSMLTRMHGLIAEGSQFVIATHSPILITYPDATILQLSTEGIRSVAYQDTEQFFITREFLNDPDRMLRVLLGDTDQ